MAIVNKELHRKVIGLIPAGGRGTRMGPIPCSKELYPIGFTSVDNHVQRAKVACHYLLEKMRAAGITEAYIILREGKWDIPAYLGNGDMVDMHLGYLMMGLPFGAPYTLNQAYPFVGDAVVAFGFPDIIFQSEDAFVPLVARQADSDADVILGLFPADQPRKVDMVDLDENGRVRDILIRPRETRLRYSWDIAIWTSAFTQFLHDYLPCHESSAEIHPELSVGEVIGAAVREGLRVEGIPVSAQPYVDIGTPEGLLTALRRFTAF